MPRVRIPEEITLTEFKAINHQKQMNDDPPDGELAKILSDTGARQATLRLNKSGTDDVIPYFIGTVQHADTKRIRIANGIPDPALSRFAYSNSSNEYREAVKKTVAGNSRDLVVEKNWRDSVSPDYDWRTKDMGSKGYARDSGITYQIYIGIKVGTRCVGMLAVGFSSKPDNYVIQEVVRKITQWARGTSPNNSLVDYLMNAFDLGGPTTR